jgi:AcrR family transcriptional regulator
MATAKPVSRSKSAKSFEEVLAAAVRLFAENGFERTTMREISRESGIALGALYYYFSSKEELVLIFYERLNQQLISETKRRGDPPKDLPKAFTAFMQEKLRLLAPHRHLLRVVMREAVDPESPLSPLSSASSKTREASMMLLGELVERSGEGKGTDAKQLVRALWALHMAILLYWLHDRSRGHTATNGLIATLAAALGWSGLIAKIPGLGGLRRDMFAHIGNIFPQDARR